MQHPILSKIYSTAILQSNNTTTTAAAAAETVTVTALYTQQQQLKLHTTSCNHTPQKPQLTASSVVSQKMEEGPRERLRWERPNRIGWVAVKGRERRGERGGREEMRERRERGEEREKREGGEENQR